MKKKKKTTSEPPSYKVYLYALGAIAVLGVLLQLASFGPLRGSLWGFHFVSFFNPVLAIAGWLILAGGAVFFLRPAKQAGARAEKTGVLSERPVYGAAGIALICALGFWLFRSQQLFLGDALPLKIDLARGMDFHPRQPLTMWLQHVFYEYAGPLLKREGMGSEDVAQRAVALGSVLAGFLYALVAVALGRAIVPESSRRTALPWLVAAVLLTQGFMQLFFGYVENYTYYALAVCLYLWLSFRFVSGSGPLLLPGLALFLAVALHLSAAVLLPSFAVLVVWGIADKRTRSRVLRDTVICAAVFFAVNQVVASLRGYNLLASLFDVSGRALGGGDARIQNYMFSFMHLRDFFNEQFLIGPLGLFLFLPAAVVALRRPDSKSLATVFFLAAGGSYLAVSWMAGDSNLGYARNWDLLAPGGVCFTAAALFFLVRHVEKAGRASRLLAFGLILSILHTAPWVWINHDESRALERMKSLPLGLGRTEVVVANWYRERGQLDEAADWFRRALDVNPNNAPAYAFLAMFLTQEGRHDESLRLYERAVALRPDKPEYRNNYALTLLELDRPEEAIPHLQWLTDRYPDEERYWWSSREALVKSGRSQDLEQVHRRLLRFAEERLAKDPGGEEANVEVGILLVLLNRDEEALRLYDRALAANPQSVSGLFNKGSLLIRMGLREEARPLLDKFVRLYPDHPNAAWARQHLQP